jgi:DNA excision repair protein ERCC-6-like 2
VFLREYQQDGVKFLYQHYKENQGALLGDDMGLGKTVQVVAFLSAIMHKTGFDSDEERRRNHVRLLQDGTSWKLHKKLPPANHTWPTCLIIAPSSVVYNWARELETWGYFEFGIFLGTEKKDVLKEFKLGRLDIVLTSFETATREIERLDNLAWSCIFVDEVHRVKNLKSKSSRALHSFKCKRRFGLTGTAIQNSYDELHAILHWTNPGLIGELKHWKRMISQPLKVGQSTTATDEEKARALVISNILVRDVLPQFFLRRRVSSNPLQNSFKREAAGQRSLSKTR